MAGGSWSPPLLVVGPVCSISFTPERMDIGVLRADESRFLTLILSNPGHQQVSLSGIESSCDCLTIIERPILLSASSTAPIRLKLENEFPEFRGKLQIEITATATDATRAAAARAKATILVEVVAP